MQAAMQQMRQMQQDRGCTMGGDMPMHGAQSGGMNMMQMMMEQMTQHQKAMQTPAK